MALNVIRTFLTNMLDTTENEMKHRLKRHANYSKENDIINKINIFSFS